MAAIKNGKVTSTDKYLLDRIFVKINELSSEPHKIQVSFVSGSCHRETYALLLGGSGYIEEVNKKRVGIHSIYFIHDDSFFVLIYEYGLWKGVGEHCALENTV